MSTKKIMISMVLLLLSVASYSNPYKEFENKKVISHKGLVGLHEVDGKVYLEMPMELLGKRLLMGAMVEACSDPLESNVGYQPIMPYTVCFQKVQSSLQLCKLNESYIPANTGNIIQSNIASVVKTFKILEHSADSSACLVDVTSYFVSNDPALDPIDPKAFNASQPVNIRPNKVCKRRRYQARFP